MSLPKGTQELLRKIPSVDDVLRLEPVEGLLKKFPRKRLVQSVRSVLDGIRRSVLDGEGGEADLGEDAVFGRVKEAMARFDRPAFLRVVNATGVVLHTGLGRGVYADEVCDALNEHVRGFTRLAYDLETGKRTPREGPVREMLVEMTGAESAQIVNNNAAATMIVLDSVARGKEVICSRGELVEIGGSFRIPEVMAMSGAVMREVGTTNKTHDWDYERAINENTGALLRVHTSNYKIRGFTEAVPLERLVELGRKYNVPVIDDLGSGTFYDMSRVGLTDETVVSESIRIGSDVICFSTDKLMSGPQGGAIVGKARWIDRIRDNPLMRALRVDKMTLITLEATLKILLDPETVWERNPTYRMLDLGLDELDRRAKRLKRRLAWLGEWCELAVEDSVSQVGGGATPVTEFPTRVVTVRPKTLTAGDLAVRLRHAPMPLCTRVKEGAVILDPRTLLKGEEPQVAKAFEFVFLKKNEPKK